MDQSDQIQDCLNESLLKPQSSMNNALLHNNFNFNFNNQHSNPPAWKCGPFASWPPDSTLGFKLSASKTSSDASFSCILNTPPHLAIPLLLYFRDSDSSIKKTRPLVWRFRFILIWRFQLIMCIEHAPLFGRFIISLQHAPSLAKIRVILTWRFQFIMYSK